MKYNKVPSELSDFYYFVKDISEDYSFIDVKLITKYKEVYIQYLNNLLLNWFRKIKQYDDEHIAEQLFIRIRKNKDTKIWVKFQALSLISSINRISDSICNKSQQPHCSLAFINGPDFLDELRLLKEVLFESIPFLDLSAYYINGKYMNWKWGKPNMVSSIGAIECSRNLLYNKLFKNRGDFVVRTSSILLIRQAIELRLKNAFGIMYIFSEGDKMIKVPGSIFIDIIRRNYDKIDFPVKTSVILKIHDWTQFYVHGGFSPHLWEIEYAHHILKPLFIVGEYKQVESIYGSIKIARSLYDNIENEVNIILNRRSSNHIKYKVVQRKSPESIIMEDQ